MKYYLSLAMKMFYLVATIIVIPLGFYNLEPSMSNMALICLVFSLSVMGFILWSDIVKEQKIKYYASRN